MYAFCLSCPSATLALQHGDFVPRKWLAAKKPIGDNGCAIFLSGSKQWEWVGYMGLAWEKEKTFNVLLLIAVQLCLTMRIKWHYYWWRKRIG